MTLHYCLAGLRGRWSRSAIRGVAPLFLVLAFWAGSPPFAAAAVNLCDATQTWSPAGTLATGRFGHTTTPLGDGTVLIAGGSDGTVSLATAQLYDPSTGSLAPTGPMGQARFDHTATLLPGGKVLIAGGVNSTTGRLSSAELYDPATHTFSATPQAMTTDRQRHAAVRLASDKVLLIGGSSTAGGILASAELYDPVAASFTALSPMGARRWLHTATRLADGTVLVAGGDGPDGDLASAEIFDPATGAFTPTTGTMGTFRALHAATLLPNGTVLVTGGDNADGTLASAELYDPLVRRFSWIGSMNRARTRHTAVGLRHGKVLIAGGFNPANGALTSVELYDPERVSFTLIEAMTGRRFDHAAALLATGAVLVAGGQDASGAIASLELYDPPFVATAPMGSPRVRHTATLLSGGTVLVTGGNGLFGTLGTAELFDPTTGGFASTDLMRSPRNDHTATRLVDGRVLLAGGGSDASVFPRAAELYTPATGAFTATGLLGAGRTKHTATLLPDGRVLIAGGFTTAAGGLASAEIYTPATGTFTATGAMGRDRRDHTATLLLDGTVLITGGTSDAAGGIDASTEIYDPATGTFTPQPAIAGLSTKRSGHTATLLPDGSVLVAGGLTTGLLTTASAELYDPAARHFTPTGALRTARVDHTATPTLLPGGAVLVAGGSSGVGGASLDTAELYDPAARAFTLLGVITLDRSAHTATFLDDGRILLAGGFSNIAGVRAAAEVSKSTLCGADLAIAMTADPDPSMVGGDLTYILTVTNDGPLDATDVTLEDTLPSGVSFRSAIATQGQCSAAAGVVTCALAALAEGGNAQVTIVVSPTAIGTATNTATVGASETDPNASDNTASVQSGVISGMDLVETQVGNPPAIALVGTSITVSDTTRNQGTALTGPSTTRYYLSLDAARDPGDTLLIGQRDVPELTAGAESPGTATVTIPVSATPASYFLIACADDLGALGESVETNNCRASATKVQVRGVPDLVVKSVSSPPASAFVGQSFPASDTVENRGSADTVASTTRYYLSRTGQRGPGDVVLGNPRSAPVIAPGQTSTGNVSAAVPLAAPTGSYVLIACADDTNANSELDETNNCQTAAGTIELLPVVDLATVAVSNPPGEAKVGTAFDVTDTVKNLGTAPVGISTTRYYLSLDAARDPGDIRLIGERNVPELSPGAESQGTTPVTIPGTTPPASYFLLACADDATADDPGIPESVETNNCLAAATKIQVRGVPDLIVKAVTSPPPSAFVGRSLSVTDTVQNRGSAATVQSTTRYYLSRTGQHTADDVRLGGPRPTPALGAGVESTGTVAAAIPLTAPTGAYVLLACADDTDVNSELDETNNCLAAAGAIEVLPLIDLTTIAVTDPPPDAKAGTTIDVIDTVKNLGTAAVGTTTTRYYLSVDDKRNAADVRLTGNRPVPALEPDRESTGAAVVTVPLTTTPGTYVVLACADDLKKSTEANENNNCKASGGSIHVSAPDLPDLVPTSVSKPPATAVRGESFSVTDTVRNAADFSAGESIVRYYLSTDKKRSTGDKRLTGSRAVPAIPARDISSGTVTVTIPLTTVPGTYLLLACADDAQAQPEISESNNCRAAATEITVTP